MLKEEVQKNLYTRQASTWFKGLGIIMVVLSHFAEWWSWFFTEEGTSELVRDGVSRFGPYGVAIFFLFSGYGLAKSAGDKRIDVRFVLKRIINVYIPYLVIVSVIKLLSGGFGIESAEDLGKFLYGDDFWYMTVLFSFYLAFMVIWFVVTNRHIRAVLMVVFTYWYSNHLYATGEQDFWYISNIAFSVGVLFTLYESYVKIAMDKVGILLTIVFGAGSIWVVRTTLYTEQVWATPLEEVRSSIIAVIIFTSFVASLAAVWKWYDPVIPVLGRYSLYFYLTHTFLFMWAVNNIELDMKLRILIAVGMIIAVSLGMGIVMDILLKPIQNLLKKKI